jgi:hypothetical protein
VPEDGHVITDVRPLPVVATEVLGETGILGH